MSQSLAKLAALKLRAGVNHYYAKIDSLLLLLLEQIVEDPAIAHNHNRLWFVFTEQI